MTYLLEKNLEGLNALYKQHETTVDDLKQNLLEQLPEFQQEFDLDFVRVERIRQYLQDKCTLFRFLRRAGFDFDMALKALIANIHWRIENGVDNLSLDDIHPRHLKNGLFFFHKTDKFNRPYAVINLRHHKRDEESPSLEEMKKYIVFNTEIARKLMWDATKESKETPILQYVVLLDLKGASVSSLNIELGPFMMDIARHHYPSSIASIFVLNYGWMYSGLWQVVKRILPQESLGRIFFPTPQEVFLYFDEENVLVEHGGRDNYVYDPDSCVPLQKYAQPLPLLKMPLPLSRVSSFDSLHDIFFSAPSTPHQSRPGTPRFNRTSTPFDSRPASPVLEHVAIPSWLVMTPSVNANRPFLHMSPMSLNERTMRNTSDSMILSPQPIKPLASPHIDLSHSSQFKFTPIMLPSPILERPLTSSNKDFQRQDYLKEKELMKLDSTIQDFNKFSVPTPSSAYHLVRLHQTFKLYMVKMLRAFFARKFSGALYWLVVIVVIRGGLVNEFWKLITRNTTMQLSWNATTTTLLTTAALSAALSGTSDNRLLVGR
ncbi:hypothetical protein G9A89_008637 [Geosiphon pyriformis]|nr:hypothetical protein G9A89_008637 [Geosiphon pyriformis]